MLTIHRLVPKRFKDSCWFGYVPAETAEASRWNHAGTNILYAAEHPALAALEISVHVGLIQLIGKYAHGIAKMPEELHSSLADIVSMPKNWQMDCSWTRDVGEQFVHDQWNVVLKVPSVIIEDGWNYLINPAHPEFSQLQLETRDHFIIDNRLAGK
ncbi:RES family NAD+ phosphorylase [Persicirhabdus sediminis]|uniref:RES family NAD+ phosphorylase n=1 Tax=Persicirhabdus sediminis TaxID=454144 RepID=A0A8J7SH85_9BACT|nr:RES family NAD+ phosphorylase [Persicirhabdus sediminis]MBK1789686.1 RES family NAD+ phosphorylase [Persicirhabdus sediminis]